MGIFAWGDTPRIVGEGWSLKPSILFLASLRLYRPEIWYCGVCVPFLGIVGIKSLDSNKKRRLTQIHEQNGGIWESNSSMSQAGGCSDYYCDAVSVCDMQCVLASWVLWYRKNILQWCKWTYEKLYLQPLAIGFGSRVYLGKTLPLKDRKVFAMSGLYIM